MRHVTRKSSIALVLLSSLLVFACARQETTTSDTGEAPPEATSPAISAVAVLSPTQGNSASGTLTFTEEAGGVRVTGDVTGLTPGDHGIHVHENGDCSAPDATSAGDHYNPTAMPHGGPDTAERHTGDLGNITADASGNARIDQVFTGLSLQGEHSVVGRAVVVHAGADDLTSQPSGGSGARIACGAIASQ